MRIRSIRTRPALVQSCKMDGFAIEGQSYAGAAFGVVPFELVPGGNVGEHRLQGGVAPVYEAVGAVRAGNSGQRLGLVVEVVCAIGFAAAVGEHGQQAEDGYEDKGFHTNA